MAIVYKNKEYRNLQEQVLENAKNIETLMGRPLLEIKKVDVLPEIGEGGVLYLVPLNPDPNTGDSDSYEEYVWVDGAWESIGSASVDISNMVTTDTEQTITARKNFGSAGFKINNISFTGIDSNLNYVQIGNLGMYLNNNNYITAPLSPSLDATYDLGKSSNQWKDLYLSGTAYIKNIDPGAGFSMNIGSSSGVVNFNCGIRPLYSTDLGSSSYNWKDLYLAGQINFSSGPSIKQDTSNRIVITDANGVERIKIGEPTSTYCAASWTPDEDNKYLLGTATLRWKAINVQSVLNPNGNLMLRGNPNINVVLANDNGAITPNSNNKFTIGTTSKVWKAVYTTTIGDDTTSVNVADIATKPNFDSPTVYASGTLDANGQGTADMETLGVPTPGLYEFNYGGVQCYVTLTTTNIQNAGTTPIIVSCPVLKDNTQYAGWLKITRDVNTLTFTIASSAGPTSETGIPWSIYKVM